LLKVNSDKRIRLAKEAADREREILERIRLKKLEADTQLVESVLEAPELCTHVLRISSVQAGEDAYVHKGFE